MAKEDIKKMTAKRELQIDHRRDNDPGWNWPYRENDLSQYNREEFRPWKLPYATHMGDASMYTAENMEARKNLKQSGRLAQYITDFMGRNFKLKGTDPKRCTKDEYCKVFMKVGLILRPGIREDELSRTLEDDWKHDAKRKIIEPVVEQVVEGEGSAAGRTQSAQ